MAFDLSIMRPFDPAGDTEANIRGTGNTNFIWESHENDIQIDALNQIITVDGTTRLSQSIMKIILTAKGQALEDPEYGTSLVEQIGEKLDTARFASIQSDIVDALIRYNTIQADNPNSDEVIEVIEEVRVVQDIDEPRALRIRVSVTTESGKTLGVAVPQLI
jgi:phage baseplate assembly protein W